VVYIFIVYIFDFLNETTVSKVKRYRVCYFKSLLQCDYAMPLKNIERRRMLKSCNKEASPFDVVGFPSAVAKYVFTPSSQCDHVMFF
jgi:hypothetical protein